MEDVQKSRRDDPLLTVDGAKRNLRKRTPHSPKSRRDDTFRRYKYYIVYRSVVPCGTIERRWVLCLQVAPTVNKMSSLRDFYACDILEYTHENN
jgi:hypothetical protein